MKYLLDTNLLTERRKGSRCSPAVSLWFENLQSGQAFISVLSIGEIRRGIEGVRRRDQATARALEKWLRYTFAMANAPAVLEPISPELQPLVDELGKLSVEDLRTVVRAVSAPDSEAPPALHPTPPEVLLAAAGIVAFGGNAVEDERALYDG